MAIATTVLRSVRFAAAEGCAHEVLLVADRPSYPNHDVGAGDAADGFVESALSHLRGWFEQWILPRLCGRDHRGEHLGDEETGSSPDGEPFTWIEFTRTLHGNGWMTLGEIGDGSGGETVSAYLLTVGAGEAELV